MLSQRSRVLRGVACVAFGGICWGFSGTCAQLLSASYGVPVTWMMCMRMCISSVFLLLTCLVIDRPRLAGLLRCPRDIAGVVVFAVLGIMLVQVCYLSCISYTNAGTATVFERLGLIVIMGYTCLRMRRAPFPREAIGLVLAIVGTVCIATKGDFSTLSIAPEGLAWGAGSAVSLAFYTLLPGRLLEKWGSLPVLSLAMAVSGIISCCLFQPWNIAVQLTFEVVAASLAMAVIGTFFAYLAFLQGLKLAGPVLSGLVGSIEPVAATAISALWLGTPTGPFDIAGCAMIVVMVLLVTQRNEASVVDNIDADAEVRALEPCGAGVRAKAGADGGHADTGCAAGGEGNREDAV